ncbi:MAG: CsgG/HfaB family protein [Myxococcales bacterium]|nr:CsgG/HfaB family protein [Myxococcales bacterium]MDP3501227.1 CsgG/HfaB family protein [Myxococcales bacterium]
MVRTLLALSLISLPALADKPLSVAVAYFDNNSLEAGYEPLARGLADMLITDLSNVQSLQLVERDKLNLALDELKLSKTKFIDPKNALKLGKGLSARYLLVGGYVVSAETMRLDARLFDVPASKVMFSEKVEGKKDEFFALEKELVELLIKALDVKLQLSEKTKLRSNATESFDAFSNYAAGLTAKDAGDEAKARAHFEAALAADPNYRAAKTATERLAVIFKRDDDAKVQTADAMRKALDPKAKDFPQKVTALLQQLQEGKTDEQKRKVELLLWLAENDLTPPAVNGLPAVAMGGLQIVYRHTGDPTQWENIPKACEYFIARYPTDDYPKSYCRGLLMSLKAEATRDRTEAMREWDEEREEDLKKLDPEDWRVSLHKNEAAMRKLIALYASKVKK